MEKPTKQLSTRSLWIYAFGIFGVQLFIGYINTYQSQFYSSMLGADLMYVAVIILVAKLISSLADTFIGNIIDRCNFRSGKMKPFILMSSLPLALLTTIMFIKINFRTQGGMYAYITITTVLWNIVMSFADIPSQGMLALLSSDSGERNTAAGLTNTLKNVALAAASLVVPVICGLYKTEVITETVYLVSAIFFGVLGLALYILIYFFVDEKVKTSPQNLSLKQMVVELKENKMLLIVFVFLVFGFFRSLGTGIQVQAAAILLKDGINIQIGSFHYATAGENLPWLLGCTTAVTSMISMIVAPVINKKIGEKKTGIYFGIYGAVVCSISFLLYMVGGAPFRSIIAILIYNAFMGFMYGPVGFLPMVMVSDIVDYREWQTGKRTEGLQFAVLSLSNKISVSLSVAVGIFIIGASGYVGGMLPAQITRNMQNLAFASYLFIPGLGMIVGSIPLFFYKIDFKTKEIMRREIEERHQMAELQAAAATVDGADTSDQA